MSEGREARLVQQLQTLTNVLGEVVARTDDRTLAALGHQYGEYIRTVSGRRALDLPGAVIERISEEVTKARDAVLEQAWHRVIQHSYTVLDVLPGNPFADPEKPPPPPPPP